MAVLSAYEWLAEQMVQRGLPRPDLDRYPVWAWYQWAGPRKQRPDLRTQSLKHWAAERRHVLLELEVDASVALLHDYDAWHFCLNYSYFGRRREDNDFDRRCEAAGVCSVRQKPMPHQALHDELVASWQGIFDMALSRVVVGSTVSNQVIQATLWELRPEYVRSAREFGCHKASIALPSLAKVAWATSESGKKTMNNHLSLAPATARAGLLGLLIGDAVGVPYEFNPPDELPPRESLDLQPPKGFRRSHQHVPVGTWSDDGALTLALLDSLTHKPELDLEDLARRMSDWETKGHYTPDGAVFDIGLQTAQGLRNWRAGTPAHRSGACGVDNNGNGALMRSLACVLVPVSSRAALVDRAMRQGLPTHGHDRSRVTCALYVLVAWNIGFHGLAPEAALANAAQSLQETLAPTWQNELALILSSRKKAPKGTGFVVDSFWTAWAALTSTNSYRECIRSAVAFGNDTDTTACLAGGLAGLLYGEAGIPGEWLGALRGKPLALKLMADAHD